MRKRIEYESRNGSVYSGILNLLAEYDRAVRAEEWAAAAGAAHRVEHAAERLTDIAITQAAARMSRRAVAEGMEITHGTVNNRINRAHERRGEENSP